MFSFENDPEFEMVHSASEFLEISLMYGIMTVPWYVVSKEGRLLVDGFVMK
jgi:hypothetical protein